MKKFKSLAENPVAGREKQISDYWDSIDILQKTIENREGAEPFVFYEGPPTANGKPGIHHVMARTLKDSVCRYQNMKGFQVKRKAGWDTHGLPVEIEVEKQLNLSDKQGIEAYGIAQFNEKCRDSVFTYEKQWREMTIRMGYSIDLDHPYITLDNNYIESVWWILDKFFREGYMYEGHKILPYCSRCGTGLASHEVALGYKEIKTNTVIVKFKRQEYDEYFLAWTTTPWTLPSNAALTVSPTETYVKVRSNDEIYYLSKTLAPKVLGDDYEVLQELKGTELEYMEYEQLMPFLTADKKAFFVTTADYVTTEDGTGIVHTAPAFGEDDYNTGKRYNLPVFQPVDESGKFIATPWKDSFVMDADLDIIKWLHAEGKLFKKEKLEHNYPHCWRCQTPLLYYAKPSWYIAMTKLKDQLVANNKTVEWYPDFVGEKRFGNWLENVNDWALSRNRYWGTPLNIWRCGCGHTASVGSRKELVEKAIEKIDETIELHRPYVDDVHIRCEKCGKPMTRVSEVIDCWFDSGAMPYAQHHYPFENKENFHELFPADFICEGIDQTRGWFYSLLAISTFVMGRSPYKRVLVNDLVLDKQGQKMSKSKGNTVDPFELFDQYGADTLRWYLLYVSPAWTPKRFDIEGLKEVQSKFFGTLRNVYTFFALYANTDEVDPRDFFIEYKKRPELDRWILSKYHALLNDVETNLAVYDLTKAVRKIQEFVSEDLSNWYIRRSRRRFWDSGLSDDKKAVYNTTYEILVGIAKISAPFAPYLAEEIYRNLTGETSVHLADYPEYVSTMIDQNVENRMDLVRNLVTLGRSAREQVRIKVRQPIQQILVDGKYEVLIADLIPLIQEELNVKEVIFANNLSDFMNFILKPNFKTAGPVFGSKIKLLGKALESLEASTAVAALEAGESLSVDVDGEQLDIVKDYVIVSISAKEGFTVTMENNLFVILDTTLTRELIDEGLARELVSKVQQMRKSNDFEMMDRIRIYFDGDDQVTSAIQSYQEYIKVETLAESIEKTPSTADLTKVNLNDHDTGVRVERI
ncbi:MULTISPECIES: isoleucine--tRNA ligase [Dehalobacter]|jgi:isoleucyl-tRNA synthetase|uniref:Isoleucine--tRNA ligase n=2 Tax=Dehalobacter restrictus TaxID=55583 RepID=A0A857DG91_9FIRM|nr:MULTISPECIES: isoleucine--tRNA ligase [Dehalobacter]AHF09194.1 isoleucyl-tRNA synthase [Dehalobacter restrictus DSM 9455]MCG1025803.1 isoleucine--tRNA ligase [Dehalobacter sp.]MDJ0306465.1 isoleucine--tRNA ligase [Dehalobacter sp.]OCZ51301.1 isoleucine--tRNA ligase [Dehalobacter sp. TeCB1]QGZ99730.1 isoleucine--tRNA ligase [Dehalobacter restrictus]